MEDSFDLVDFEILKEAADRLKVLAHPVRLRLIEILLEGDFTEKDLEAFSATLSVKEVAQLSGIPQNKASEHLRLMKSHKLLMADRVGKSVFYKINCKSLPIILECMTRNKVGES
jgi:ArsR family transcriptional regulator, zinc-responsive transcriptional repressor